MSYAVQCKSGGVTNSPRTVERTQTNYQNMRLDRTRVAIIFLSRILIFHVVRREKLMKTVKNFP